MQTETFNTIIGVLENRCILCEQYLKDINTTDDLTRLTIGQAQELQKFCRAEESLMTKIMQVDLYHIIGMGNLTPPQMMKFTYLIKDYLKYRSIIKSIAFNFESISNLPGIPTSSIYKLSSFNNIALYSGSDLTTNSSNNVPYSISGQTIKVTKDQAANFIAFWSNMAKVNFSLNNLMSKAKAVSEYGGIKWCLDEKENLIGKCTTCVSFGGFEAAINN